MASCITTLLLLLLCNTASNVKGNTENTNEAKIPDQKENKPSNESQTQAPNNEVNVTVEAQRTTNSPGQVNHTAVSALDHPQNTTVQEEQSTSDVGHSPNQTAANRTIIDGNPSNDTLQPAFRRYIHFTKNNTPVVEKLLDQQWILVSPVKQPGEVHSTNISRFVKSGDGTLLIMVRSKYEYSYDGVHWFWPTRVKYKENDATKFKFGPRKWVDSGENNLYFGNRTNLTYEDLGAGPVAYRFHKENSFFRPPANYKNQSNIEHNYNRTLTNKKQIYEYGPPLGRNARVDPRYNRRFYGDYRDAYRPRADSRWGPPLPPPPPPPHPPPPPPPNYPRYYDSYRNSYNDPRYERRDPYYDGRRDGPPRDDSYYDRRYRPVDRQEDRRYLSSEPRQEGRHHYDDDGYQDRKYERKYDDGRYRSEGGNYDNTRYDRGYNSERRRYDENDYDRRTERPAYGDTSRFSNDTSDYEDGGNHRTTRRRYPYAERRIQEHGDSFETYKWKFVYLDRNKIPEDRRKQEKYFLKEYHDILEKASRHIWKSHRDIRTILPDFEVLREEGVINNSYVIPIVNGSLALLNNVANRISFLIDQNVTLGDLEETIIDRKLYGRSINNFDKMSEIFRQCRIPRAPNPKLENLINKVFDQKKYLYITYSDISHMLSVLRRTLKRYGSYELSTTTEALSMANGTDTSSTESRAETSSTESKAETSSTESKAETSSTESRTGTSSTESKTETSSTENRTET